MSRKTAKVSQTHANRYWRFYESHCSYST